MLYIKGTFKILRWYTKETLISRARRSDKEKTVFVVGCFGERAGTCVTGCPLSEHPPTRNRPPFQCTPRVNSAFVFVFVFVWTSTDAKYSNEHQELTLQLEQNHSGRKRSNDRYSTGQTYLIPQGMVKQSVNSI